MPSPLGHALAGFAVGWVAAPDACGAAAVSSAPGVDRADRFTSLRRWRWPMAFVAAGLAADLDLVVGLHSRYTHSVGAVLLVFLGAWLALRGRQLPAVRVALALASSYGSHVLIDWLGSDTTPPLGVMALWPFSGDFYLSPWAVFMGISRKYWLAATWGQNAVSVLREVAILLPLAGLAAWWRGMPPLKPPRRQKLHRSEETGSDRRKSTNP